MHGKRKDNADCQTPNKICEPFSGLGIESAPGELLCDCELVPGNRGYAPPLRA